MTDQPRQADKDAAERRADYLVGLLWHLGAFIVIGVFLGVLDWLADDRLGWSAWVMGIWAIGLAFHALAYLIEGSGLKDRKAQQFETDMKDISKSKR